MHEVAFRRVCSASARLALSTDSKPENFLSCSHDKTSDYISSYNEGLPCIFFLWGFDITSHSYILNVQLALWILPLMSPNLFFKLYIGLQSLCVFITAMFTAQARIKDCNMCDIYQSLHTAEWERLGVCRHSHGERSVTFGELSACLPYCPASKLNGRK